jgi:flagellar basal-body rod modification protein FlgD
MPDSVQGLTTNAGPSTPKANGVSNTDNKDLFLKLMVEQMSHQDPMNPTDSDQWLAQMAQFNSVEQLGNLVTANSQSQAVGLLGKKVTYTGADDDGQSVSVTGTVQKVSMSKAGPTLTVDGQIGVLLTSISEVA